MGTIIKLFSNEKGEIYKFLNKFYNRINTDIEKSSLLEWEKTYENPVEMADIIGVFIDNKDDFKINMWVSFDKDILINVSEKNVDELIKYLYERFPY